MAAAGIDALERGGRFRRPFPLDPDGRPARCARYPRAHGPATVAVVVTDTAGRAWREGQTSPSGAAGSVGHRALRGRTDARQRALGRSRPSPTRSPVMAELAQGKLTGRPFAVCGTPALPAGEHGPGASSLVRAGGDLLGTAPAGRRPVPCAAASPGDEPFGALRTRPSWRRSPTSRPSSSASHRTAGHRHCSHVAGPNSRRWRSPRQGSSGRAHERARFFGP